MLRASGSLVLRVLSILLAGCASSAIEMAPVRPDLPWTPRVSAAGEIVPGAKSDASVGATYELPANPKVANVPAPPVLERERPYTLAELIDVAQSNNPLTRTAWNHAREAALAAGIVRSAYLPKVTANVIQGYQNNQNRSPAGGISTDVSAQGAIAAFSIQWLLFDFGERSALLNAAKQGSVISNITFTAAHQQLIHAVSLAFYTNAAARARADTAVRSLKNAQEVQAAAEHRYAHDIGTVIEVAQARQATAQAQLFQVQAEGAAQNAYLALISAMGISPLTQMRIADISDRKLPAAVTDSVEQIVAEALGRRPDVLAAYAAQRASLENVRAARAEFLPKFFVSATGAYNTQRLDVTAIPSVGEQLPTVNLSGNRFGVTLFAGVTVPIYDGGTRAAVLKQARTKADNADLALTRTQEEAVREIVLAENTLRTSMSAYDAAKSLASAAQTTFDAALASYRSGVGSITEATLAESQLLQAQIVLTDTHSAVLSSAATLALAVGTLGSAPL